MNLADKHNPSLQQTAKRNDGQLARTSHIAPQLKGVDLQGRLHRLGRSPNSKAVAIVFLSTECPVSNGCIPILNRLADQYRDKQVEFYGVISDHTVTRSEALHHHRQYRIRFQILFDTSGELRRQLGPTHTPQAFVLDPWGRVLYSGAIDNQYVGLGRKKRQVDQSYLASTLAAVIANQPIRVTTTEPIGCLIEQPQNDRRPSDITYARDIAPIIQANCVDCHRPAAVAPFPLTNYQEVSKRARQIRLVTQLRVMPPWKPISNFGHFRDERQLSRREIALIATWVESGKVYGDPANMPPPKRFVNGWQLGTPDLVLRMSEPFHVPAEGADIYQYFVIPTGLKEDRLVAAIEYRPSNPQVVHHASFRYDNSGTARRLDAADPRPGYQRFGGWGFNSGGTLGGWALGVLPHRFPAHMGRLIKKNSDFVLQTHYHPNGKSEQDQSMVGLYFAPKPAHTHVGELFVANMNLEIPPCEERYHHQASYTLPVDTVVHSVLPHMHLLGRECKSTATLPDGRIKPLICITDWDFSWQESYFYATPLRLPKGTRIDFEIYYDNSESNRMNPHFPPKRVYWGEQSTEEMGVCFFDVTTDCAEDLKELIRHNRAYTALESRQLFGRFVGTPLEPGTANKMQSSDATN